MRTGYCGLVLAAALSSGAAWSGDEVIVRFEGGIGADPVGGIASGAPVANTVRGVPPGGRPWAIGSLRATVRGDGTLVARGTGLIFSGGDSIGTRGGVAQVFATLFCDAAAHNSAPVDLDLAGNFSIRGALSPLPPDPCNAPVLLIRNAAGSQSWFAAGIPRLGDED